MPLTHLNSLLDSNYIDLDVACLDSVQHLCNLYSIYNKKSEEQQAEINPTYDVRLKTFRKAGYRREINFISHKMKDEHNIDIIINYSLYNDKAEEEDVNNIVKYFLADQKIINNQCTQLGLDFIVKEIKQSGANIEYFFIISNIKNFHVTDLDNLTKDEKKHLESNPDNIEEIWRSYDSFLKKYSDNPHYYTFPYVFNLDQINVFSNDDEESEDDIEKAVMFNKNVSNSASINIIYLVKSDYKLLCKYVEFKVKDILLQCMDAGLLSNHTKTENGEVSKYIISIEYE